jgi:hypothetical protein
MRINNLRSGSPPGLLIETSWNRGLANVYITVNGLLLTFGALIRKKLFAKCQVLH